MKRIAAYCRVSTDKDDQLNSLENQKEFFKDYIQKNGEWEFADLYVDEGISGTNIRKRTGFKQMIKDGENNKFDLLITKEISRFARNTLDSIYYTRKLKSLGIGVIFLNDNINTLDADSELRLTIMASIAQEESRKTSERVKWGQKRQMEKGVVFGSKVFGYDLKNGKLYVTEKEADIVRLIYQLYLEDGMGTHQLAKELENRGIPTPTGAKQWSNATIFKILKNEKYIGNLVQKKSITVDFLTHKKKRNLGEEELVIKENTHEPIIERVVFDAIQREIERRRTFIFDYSKYSNRYAWSGKIECGLCGGKFTRRIRHKGKNCQAVVWQCLTNSKYGAEKLNKVGEKVGCNLKAIRESVLEKLFTLVLKDIIKNKNKIISNLENAIVKVLEDTQVSDQIKDIANQVSKLKKHKDKLIELYNEDLLSKPEFKEKNDDYNRLIEQFNFKLSELNTIEDKIKENKKIIKKIKTMISQLVNAQVFSEKVCRELLQKIIIYGPDHIKITLNGSIEKEFFFDQSHVPILKTQSLYHLVFPWLQELACYIFEIDTSRMLPILHQDHHIV